jgi:hypothetical protein
MRFERTTLVVDFLRRCAGLTPAASALPAPDEDASYG